DSRPVEAPHPTGESNVAPPDAALIRLRVPDKFAVVSFNGQTVSSTGTARTFVTPHLGAGKSGHYEIKSTWGAGNQQTSRESVVEAGAGQVRTGDFTSGSPSAAK